MTDDAPASKPTPAPVSASSPPARREASAALAKATTALDKGATGRSESGGTLLVIGGVALMFWTTSQLVQPEKTQPILYVLFVVGLVVLVVAVYLLARSLKKAAVHGTDGTGGPVVAWLPQLTKNYDLLRRQTTIGFGFTVGFFALGMLVILVGGFGSLFGLAGAQHSLTVVAGVISEFISGGALVLYRINFERLNETSRRLEETLRILTAVSVADELPEHMRTEATMRLIDALVGARSR